MSSHKIPVNTSTTASLSVPAVWPICRPFVIGAITGCTSITIFQPIDTIKVRIQIMGDSGPTASSTTNNKVNLFTMGRHILKTEGIFSFYKGLSAQYTRQLTYGTTRLGMFRLLTNHFTPDGGKASDISFTVRAACSIVAGGIGAVIGTPAEAALVRMQSDAGLSPEKRRNYKNVFDALFRMVREEGIKNGIFAGATPTITRAMVMNFGLLSSYDSIHAFLIAKLLGNTRDDNDDNDNININGNGNNGLLNAQSVRLMAGFLSGVCGATLTLPFDFLKTRMQKQVKFADGSYPYRNVFDCAIKVIRNEGIGTFYVGYFTFVVRVAPIVSFQWLLMDNLKIMFQNRGL